MPSTTLSATYSIPLLTTAIASGSNLAALPQSTIHVNSTNGFPTVGTFIIVLYTTGLTGSYIITYVNYTGITSTTFTGCSGGTGTLATNDFVQVVGSTTGASNIQVASTTGFPTVGQLLVNGTEKLSYTGISGNTFTGVTGGDSATISTGQSVVYSATGNAQTVSILNTMHNDPNNGQSNTYGAALTSLTGAENFAETNLGQANSYGYGDLSGPTLLTDIGFYSDTNYDIIAPVNYKMRGYYATGQIYETWIVQGQPSYHPPSGHSLTNIVIEEIF